MKMGMLQGAVERRDEAISWLKANIAWGLLPLAGSQRSEYEIRKFGTVTNFLSIQP
jgi:hypothetical protein